MRFAFIAKHRSIWPVAWFSKRWMYHVRGSTPGWGVSALAQSAYFGRCASPKVHGPPFHRLHCISKIPQIFMALLL